MALWGVSGPVEDAKPKWLTEEEKTRTTATSRGWEYEQISPEGRTKMEVLVAVTNLDQKVEFEEEE